MKKKKCDYEGRAIVDRVAAGVLMLVAGFVLGWLWDKRPGALGGVSLLGVLTAIGTIGAALGAAYSSWFIANQSRNLQNQKNKILKINLNEIINSWDLFVDKFYRDIKTVMDLIESDENEYIKGYMDRISDSKNRSRGYDNVDLKDKRLESASAELYSDYVKFHNLVVKWKDLTDQNMNSFRSSPEFGSVVKKESLMVFFGTLDEIVVLMDRLKFNDVISRVSCEYFPDRYSDYLAGESVEQEKWFPKGFKEVLNKPIKERV